jgi:hypothetical protein
VKASMTEGKRPVCVVEKAKLKVGRNKYFQKNPRWLCGMTVTKLRICMVCREKVCNFNQLVFEHGYDYCLSTC